MPTNRPREARKAVRISVRVRTDDGWIDATVRNVSSRGMMLQSHQPLRRNQFVEVTRGRQRVVGRIVWSDASVCGVHSREAFDLADLNAPSDGARASGKQDRRESRRDPAPFYVAPFAERADASRMRGRAFEHGFMVIAVISAAVVGTIGIAEVFEAPLAKVELAIGG